jgi:hypothetical protein
LAVAARQIQSKTHDNLASSYDANLSGIVMMGVPSPTRPQRFTRIEPELLTHIAESRRRSWVRTAVFVGIVYALVGIVFAVPATHVRAWRLAAWIVSIMAYAAHIACERFRLRNSPGSASLHVALAAALGAFGLAVGANIHSLSAGPANQHRHLLLLALGVWPVITALPAFFVAFAANIALLHALGNVQDQ